MKVAFLHSDKPRERILADAWLLGAKAHGHETEAIPLGEPFVAGRYDVACMVGVKSRDIFATHHRAGVHILYFDKGYARWKRTDPLAGWQFWRVSINAHQPTARLAQEQHPSDRFDRLELRVEPWREEGGHILIAGSSAKYHEFYGLKEPTTFAKDLVRDLRARSGRELVYRPKPSWREAVPIKKTRFSTLPEGINEALSGAHALVTHGSNACFEAVLAGVPCITLGPAVAAPISSLSVDSIEWPKLADDGERHQWLANLAYWQWTASEMASGEAWATVGAKLHG